MLHRTVRPDATLQVRLPARARRGTCVAEGVGKPAAHRRAPQVSLRLLGGGGDGGATGAESRSSYLEMYKEQSTGKLDAREELLAVWTLCRLTRSPLGGPDGRRQVVLCPLGCMYDREAVLNALKERSVDGIPLPPLVAHVKSLKSLTTLQMHLSEPAELDTSAAAVAVAADFREPRAEHVRFSCPLTGLQMNGRYRFVALCPSGVVVSERALKSAPAAVEELLGGAPLSSQQRVPIYGTAEEVDALRAALAAKAAASNSGKGSKRKAEAAAAPAEAPAPAHPAPVKRLGGGVAPAAPAGATKEVWASLFTSSGAAPKTETFGARNVSARR